jgi:hypothetical protein
LSQATNATTLMVIVNNGCVRVRKKVYETNAYSWLIFWFQTQCWRKNLNSFKANMNINISDISSSLLY